MLRTLILCSLVAISGCKDESPPRWADVCTKTSLTVSYVMNSNGGLSPIWIPYCARYEKRCVVGKDYTGINKECGEQEWEIR